jgi:hypothetical protein
VLNVTLFALRQKNHTLLRAMRLVILSFLLVILAPSALVTADVPPEGIPPSYQMMAENEQFQLYVDSSTLAFKLLDKRSNYLWHSGLDELIEGDRLNRSWQAFALSGISIEYLDARATNNRISISSATHTLELADIEEGLSATVRFDDFGITLGISLQLEAEGLRLEIPFTSIRQENPEFRLAKVYVYPFLGSTRGSNIPGYMLLPDGVGSLVRYSDSTKAQNMFYGRYYGSDLGMIDALALNEEIIPPSPISFPVFGVVHGEGQNAFFSVVEKGAAYGEVQMHPAGVITNFNFIYNAFIYNETYFQATNRSGAGVTTVQRQTNSFNAVIHYRFLTGDAADYIGMAQSYQGYLLDNGVLARNEEPNPNIGVRLEFLGGDKERILLWTRFVPMTTIAQVNTILDELQIPNAELIYYGWQPQGAFTMPPRSVEVEGSLGSLGDLSALAERIAADGGHFSLYLEPQVALRREVGYSTRSDLAMAITNVAVGGIGRHFYNYYFSFDALQERYSPLAANIASELAAGLALDGIGSVLYSDFRDENPRNREAAIEAYQTLLSESPVRLSFYRPNDYLFGLAQAYYDMPLGDNGYVYTTETVPFLPIVLAGYIPYYGSTLNFSSNLQDDLLRHVEYGIYPSYFLTHEPTANMLNTASAFTIYTSSYAQWGEEVRSSYQWMNALLAPVRGQEIIDHKTLAEGVYATTYANGRQIIVNYTELPFVYAETTVEAKNALLLENES